MLIGGEGGLMEGGEVCGGGGRGGRGCVVGGWIERICQRARARDDVR